MRRLLRALLLIACVPAGVPAAARPHVYLVIVDGLDARFATPALMPHLFALMAAERERTSFFPGARAVMPTRTNPNHVSLLTGVYPEAHGITGNAYWSRQPGAAPAKLDDAALIDVETLFTVAETTAPELVTVGVFAKPKLGRLFAAVPDRQRAPDVLWAPGGTPAVSRDAATGYSTDADTMGVVVDLLADHDPDLTVVNIADVDRTAHGRGPESPECERAVGAADAAIDRLVARLRELGRWPRSVLVVTADHGFSSVAPTPERPYPVITLGRALLRAGVRGVHVVADGGVEHVYADGLADGLAADGLADGVADGVAAGAAGAGDAATVLARVAAVARDEPGVTEVLARIPVEGVRALAAVHPNWHLAHQRTGDLLLVAARGFEFVDPFDPVDAGLLGNHGGPDELAIPLVITGGADALRAAPPGTPAPTSVDVAPTIGALLGLRAPRRVDGSAVAPESSGRLLAAVLADARGQSPH